MDCNLDPFMEIEIFFIYHYVFFYSVEENETQSNLHSELVGTLIIIHLSSENISFTCSNF